MSDNESIEDVNNIIDKNYNIDYDINERLRFLQDKYKDYEIKIINNNIKKRKKGGKKFQRCCINFDCITSPGFCIKGETTATYCKNCSLLTNQEMIDVKHKKCIKCNNSSVNFCRKGEVTATHCGNCAKIIENEESIEMIAIYAKNKKCIICNKTQANYAKIGENKATHCLACSILEEYIMENVNTKKCIKCVKNRASFCRINEKIAKFCGSCADIISEQENSIMINISHKSHMCIKCEEKYASFCKIGEKKQLIVKSVLT